MKTITTRLAFAALAASVAATAAHAAPLAQYTGDLPILVDRYYEIKHPDGPVTDLGSGWTWSGQVDAESLTKVPQYTVPRDLDPLNDPKRNIGF